MGENTTKYDKIDKLCAQVVASFTKFIEGAVTVGRAIQKRDRELNAMNATLVYLGRVYF